MGYGDTHDPYGRYITSYDSRFGITATGKVYIKDTKTGEEFIKNSDGTIEDKSGHYMVFDSDWVLRRKY